MPIPSCLPAQLCALHKQGALVDGTTAPASTLDFLDRRFNQLSVSTAAAAAQGQPAGHAATAGVERTCPAAAAAAAAASEPQHRQLSQGEVPVNAAAAAVDMWLELEPMFGSPEEQQRVLSLRNVPELGSAEELEFLDDVSIDDVLDTLAAAADRAAGDHAAQAHAPAHDDDLFEAALVDTPHEHDQWATTMDPGDRALDPDLLRLEGMFSPDALQNVWTDVDNKRLLVTALFVEHHARHAALSRALAVRLCLEFVSLSAEHRSSISRLCALPTLAPLGTAPGPSRFEKPTPFPLLACLSAMRESLFAAAHAPAVSTVAAFGRLRCPERIDFLFMSVKQVLLDPPAPDVSDDMLNFASLTALLMSPSFPA